MARITTHNPPGVRAPTTRYSHGAVIEGEGRRLFISGQVGIDLDGNVSSTGEEQIAQAFANLQAVLHGCGMEIRNIAKLTIYLTDRSMIGAFRAARDALFVDHAPAATLLFVAGLADPRWVVEIEAEAVS